MSIEKYLENIKTPQALPGPFSVRLKYELKKELFAKRTNYWLPALSAGFSLMLLILVGLIVIRPDIADDIHYVFFKQERLQHDLFPETNLSRETFASSGSSIVDMHNTRVVKDLSRLDETKSYMVKKVRNSKNKNVYFISEVKKRKVPKVLY